MSLFNNRVMDNSDEITVANYERVKVVGQGSFGVAVLYKRLPKEDLVVLKQIRMADLNASEREMALNEVEVFSKLHHPNIISYMGNFMQNGVLLIEMEYADGGNLAQIINDRSLDNLFPERYILSIFEQITSALAYMHSQNILHRDLKTANVFLNKKGTVKLGDFGISKIVSTKVHAQTVLGTPYYFSPEMCEGKEYDDRSDVWALGCVLVEMCCLRKAFSAANLTELISKIMVGQYLKLPGGYSDCTRSLASLLFEVEAFKRPSAKEILEYWIPLIYRNLGPYKGYQYQITESIESKFTDQMDDLLDETLVLRDLRPRSILYNLQSFGQNLTIKPIPLPSLMQIDSISSSESHFIVVSKQGVYAWGESKHGQLGHGNPTNLWTHYPMEITSLSRARIIKACAGNGFSVFLSESGEVYSAGSNMRGCLGLGREIGICQAPQRLQLRNIKQIKCGSHHVICVGANNDLFSWGSSEVGALGLGAKTKAFAPILISFNVDTIVDVFCGPEASLFITKSGSVFACGNNTHNVLGLGATIKQKSNFTKIDIPKKVTNLCVSHTHSAFVTEGGYVITMGDNRFGQRGIGHTIPIPTMTLVTGIRSKFIKSVECHSEYTVALSDDNVLSVWGTRTGIPKLKTASNNNKPRSEISNSNSEICNNTVAFSNFLASVYQSESILDPLDILALYSPSKQGVYIKFVSVLPLKHSMLALVETTCPFQ